MGSVMNQFLNRSTLFDFFLITAGNVLVAFSFVVMVVPNGLLSMGFTGVAVILHRYVPMIPISLFYYLIDGFYVL